MRMELLLCHGVWLGCNPQVLVELDGLVGWLVFQWLGCYGYLRRCFDLILFNFQFCNLGKVLFAKSTDIMNGSEK